MSGDKFNISQTPLAPFGQPAVFYVSKDNRTKNHPDRADLGIIVGKDPLVPTGFQVFVPRSGTIVNFPNNFKVLAKIPDEWNWGSNPHRISKAQETMESNETSDIVENVNDIEDDDEDPLPEDILIPDEDEDINLMPESPPRTHPTAGPILDSPDRGRYNFRPRAMRQLYKTSCNIIRDEDQRQLSKLMDNQVFIYATFINEAMKEDKLPRKIAVDEAINKELRQMKDLKVFETCLYKGIPEDRRGDIIHSLLFLKDKYTAEGIFDKIKARLAARGDMQL